MTRRASIAAIDIPRRKVVSDVTLTLPMPPSANRLWRAGRGRVYPSPEYEAWKREAGYTLCNQHPGRIDGRYALHLRVARNDTRADIGNLEKPTSDLLQAHGVIQNDKLCEGITVNWNDAPGASGILLMLVATRSAVSL